MNPVRCSCSVTAGLMAVILAGCGGGTASLPQTGGVEPGTYMGYFGGRWILSPETSDDLSSIPEPPGEDAGPEAPPEGGVARPGGRRRPGMPSQEGRRRMAALDAQGDVEAARATLEVLRMFPENFFLEVGESEVVTTWVGGTELRIPVAGEDVTAQVGERRVRATAGWEGPVLRIELDVQGGRTIVDRIEPVPESNRLLLVRTVDAFAGEVPDLRLGFDKADRR